MGKLIVTDSSGQSQEFPLDRERISIGRHPDNDVALNDKAVSGRHAVIITVLHDSFLEDLESTNGTLVNGRAISKHPLAHGDEIMIGRNRLRYEADAGAEDDFEKTMILRPGQLGAAFESQLQSPAAPAPAAAKPLLGKLRVASGPNAGKELDLSKALTTVGKPGVQVAAITRRADGYYIVHVGGDSGGKRALVNGQEINTQARKLQPGDTIELLGTQMSFFTA
ncbi:FHA domain-containing protein [Solimonas flava]|uniref:FHA domain-containing protein n=1 Tax=Solimonas flava TaxID=415849 RepID=UPI0003F63060|nr:FHA domain-containing protein [Solimonas flava]